MNDHWVDRAAYPFQSRLLDVDGGRMHYIDEGAGEPILFVHGTPVWSFVYRQIVVALRGEQRCIAPDQLGFGLSDKPAGWGYSFADHARNLEQLIERLELRRFTLVVHDLGGPIGLSYALKHPERIARILILNTFLWPMEGSFAVPPLGKLFGGPLGRWLYLRQNVSARMLLPMVYGDRSKLTPAIHAQYTRPFPQPDDRRGMFAFAQQMAAGATWCAELWARREALRRVPSSLIWGMKDPAFGPTFLARWRDLLPSAPVRELPTVGHFVQEEAPGEIIAALRAPGVTLAT
jgi:haloalkane dehalogenase